MRKKPRLFYKTLVVSFIICFMLLSPSTLAITKEYINHPPNAPIIIRDSRPRPRTTDSCSRSSQLPIGFPPTIYWNITTTDPDKNDIYLQIQWGDGNYKDWFGPYHSGEKVSVNHTYGAVGTYCIKARAKDTYGAIGPWGTEQIPIGDNSPPDAPDIDGPVRGKPRVEYDFVFSTTDPEGDDVSYYVEWGDGTSNGWTDYYPSGADVLISHIWKKIDWDNIIRAKAKDIHGAESDWSITPVPINKVTVNHLFLRFLEQFPFLEVFLRIMSL